MSSSLRSQQPTPLVRLDGGNSSAQLALGADIEDFPAAVQYRVYKPVSQGLSTIVNFVDPVRLQKAAEEARALGFARLPTPVEIGSLRYTSADLRHRGSDAEVTINIQPFDLLGRRTGVFGMTRTGKSNFTKTAVSELAIAAASGGVKVGQLIFDINGEYANANAQDDGSSIAEAFGEIVVRYRGLPQDGFRDIRNNFFINPHIGLAVLQDVIRAQWKNPGGDLTTFLNMSLDEPDDRNSGDWHRWRQSCALFQCLLATARFQVPANFRVRFGAAASIRDQIYEKASDDFDPNDDRATREAKRDAFVPDPENGLTVQDAIEWFRAARLAMRRLEKEDSDRQKANPPIPRPRGVYPTLQRDNRADPWFDPTARALVNLLVGRNELDNNIRSQQLIGLGRDFHSPHRTQDVSSEIYNLLEDGKIVILDLTVGPLAVRQAMALDIAEHVFRESMTRFVGRQTPPNVVLYLEEAHNLIGKKDDLDATWPRIAKEGAKYRISLVYATQEPSSIHPNILANTENWFVTHLNNDDEIRTLSKFYDFGDFAASLKRVQDVGFARVKTLSSSFVVPTQIRKFEPGKVTARWADARRAAAGR